MNRSPGEFFNFMSVWIEQHNVSWTLGAREGSKPLGNDGKLATDILAVIRHSMPDLLKVVDCSEAIALPQEQRVRALCPQLRCRLMLRPLRA